MHPQLDTCSGHRQPRGPVTKTFLSQKWVAIGFFFVAIGLWVGVVVFVLRVCPSLAIPPYHRSSFLEQGK